MKINNLISKLEKEIKTHKIKWDKLLIFKFFQSTPQGAVFQNKILNYIKNNTKNGFLLISKFTKKKWNLNFLTQINLVKKINQKIVSISNKVGTKKVALLATAWASPIGTIINILDYIVTAASFVNDLYYFHITNEK
ncbi:hypothetical protein [Mesomycoplasma neurolyticum]|uniref:Uncharacterized protein n=1 Tax=Mesomycoplasma neurolyticum TaxID=2120 RepID=A0A449A6I3_9BACT|nr:hypothetical protein [Mesomycoplasma neurolyticum]VEU59827.1 Uncharacterised protein [Mesomycoplasma neurolyticum]